MPALPGEIESVDADKNIKRTWSVRNLPFDEAQRSVAKQKARHSCRALVIIEL